MISRHLHRVLLNDIDAAGVVFYARLFAIAHEAYEQVLLSAGIDLARIITQRTYALPVVHAHCDFHHPVRHGEVLAIDVHCAHIGNTSYSCRMLLSLDASVRATPIAQILQVHACVDVARTISMPLPDTLVQALRSLPPCAAAEGRPKPAGSDR